MSADRRVAACSKLMPSGIGLTRPNRSTACWQAPTPEHITRSPGHGLSPRAGLDHFTRPFRCHGRPDPDMAAMGKAARGREIGAIERRLPHLHQPPRWALGALRDVAQRRPFSVATPPSSYPPVFNLSAGRGRMARLGAHIPGEGAVHSQSGSPSPGSRKRDPTLPAGRGDAICERT